MSLFLADADCTVSAIHVTTADLFIGLQNGMLLIVDILTLSLVIKLHCHESRVKPLFTLSVSNCLYSLCISIETGKGQLALLG